MEENQETKLIPQVIQEETREEKPDNQDEVEQEVNIIPMPEVKILTEETKERKNESKEKIAIDNKKLQPEKVGEDHTDSSKKPKQAAKKIAKTKITVPKPFSLATDKRMSGERRLSMDLSSLADKRTLKERRASVDFKYLQPQLSKSASLNYKAQSLPSAREASNLKRSATTAKCSRPKVTSTDPVDNKNGVKSREKIQVKEVQSRYLQSIPKKQPAKELESNKLKKSSTFKALPLPSFNHRKEQSPKSETKKIPATHPKSPPLACQRNKSKTDARSNKTEDKSMSTVQKTISNSAKETLNKLIKGTRKALITSKETVKSVISSAQG